MPEHLEMGLQRNIDLPHLERSHRGRRDVKGLFSAAGFQERPDGTK
jgi:hypothetical protein